MPDDSTSTSTTTTPNPDPNGGKPPEKTAETVQLTKEEHAALLEKAKAAEEVAIARRVFSKEATEDQRIEAMATLMASAGYTDEEIIAHLSAEEQNVPNPQNQNSNKGRKQEDEDPILSHPLVVAMQQKLDALEKRTDSSRIQSLEARLNREVGDQLSKKELAEIMKAIGEGRKDSELEELQGTVRGDILEESKRLLRQKRDQFGEFREDWISEAASQAAEKVAKKVRAYGGANRVGRSQELDLAEDEFLKSPPKTLPKEAPKSAGDIDKAIDDFATDQLLRAASELSRGGKTQV